MAIVVDPCLAERAAEEKNLLVSISAWKLIITVLANIMAMVVDPFLSSRIRCRRNESAESLSAWKLVITMQKKRISLYRFPHGSFAIHL